MHREGVRRESGCRTAGLFLGDMTETCRSAKHNTPQKVVRSERTPIREKQPEETVRTGTKETWQGEDADMSAGRGPMRSRS